MTTKSFKRSKQDISESLISGIVECPFCHEDLFVTVNPAYGNCFIRAHGNPSHLVSIFLEDGHISNSGWWPTEIFSIAGDFEAQQGVLKKIAEDRMEGV